MPQTSTRRLERDRPGPAVDLLPRIQLGYRDGYPAVPIIQQGYFFSLYLLARHGVTWLWWLTDDPQLSRTARSAIADPAFKNFPIRVLWCPLNPCLREINPSPIPVPRVLWDETSDAAG